LTTATTNGTSAPGLVLPITDDHLPGVLAPRRDWYPLYESEHVVQFYETDAFLLHALSEFIATGLTASDACIVVATPAHRAGLDERLQATGLDLVAAHTSGQYVVLDAAETLTTFLVNDSPEPGRFTAVIGDLIARSTERGHQVRVFGEMVALLWAEGQYDAALRLEGLWNDLLTTSPFVLFCAYPIHGFGGEALAHGLGQVCATHARVIPAESYTTLTTEDDRLRAISLLL
jgi:hypothetical protein